MRYIKFILLLGFLAVMADAASTRYIDADALKNSARTKTYTLPTGGASSTTLLTTDDTQTVTGKSMSGASNTFSALPLTSAVTGVLPVANGGTNSSAALSNLRIMYSSGGTVIEAPAITASRAIVSDANGVPTHATTTTTEVGYLSGVSSAVQTQLNAKAPAASPTFTGTVTTPLTASRAVVTGASSDLAASAATATEVGYLSGVSSSIQTQLNGKTGITAFTSKVVDYTVTTSEAAVGYDSTANLTATLLTAVGNSGRRFTIAKTSTGTSTVTVNTTSSQTIGGKPSGLIVLTQPGDFISVESDGANWVLVGQNYHETLSTVSSIYDFTDGGTDADYGLMTGNSLPLTYGCWDVSQTWTILTGTAGVGIVLYSGTGLFGANGDNTGSAPTALSVASSSGIKNYSDVQSTAGIPNSGTAGLRLPVFEMKSNICVTTPTTIYAVPRIGFGTISTAATYVQLLARRTK